MIGHGFGNPESSPTSSFLQERRNSVSMNSSFVFHREHCRNSLISSCIQSEISAQDLKFMARKEHQNLNSDLTSQEAREREQGQHTRACYLVTPGFSDPQQRRRIKGMLNTTAYLRREDSERWSESLKEADPKEESLRHASRGEIGQAERWKVRNI